MAGILDARTVWDGAGGSHARGRMHGPVAGAQRALDAFALPVRQMLELCGVRTEMDAQAGPKGRWAVGSGPGRKQPPCCMFYRSPVGRTVACCRVRA